MISFHSRNIYYLSFFFMICSANTIVHKAFLLCNNPTGSLLIPFEGIEKKNKLAWHAVSGIRFGHPVFIYNFNKKYTAQSVFIRRKMLSAHKSNSISLTSQKLKTCSQAWQYMISMLGDILKENSTINSTLQNQIHIESEFFIRKATRSLNKDN